MSQPPVAPPGATPISFPGRILRTGGAAVIVTSGVALAWPFRTNPTQRDPVAAAATNPPAPLVAESAQVAFQMPGQLPAAAPLPSPKLLVRQTGEEPEPTRPSPTTSPTAVLNAAPPELAPQFIRSSGFTGNTTSEGRDLSMEPIRDPQPREHRLVDGDTLRRLAQRYLGDANRWPEIQAANADALANPAVIPLGKTIRIPPRSP